MKTQYLKMKSILSIAVRQSQLRDLNLHLKRFLRFFETNLRHDILFVCLFSITAFQKETNKGDEEN